MKLWAKRWGVGGPKEGVLKWSPGINKTNAKFDGKPSGGSKGGSTPTSVQENQERDNSRKLRKVRRNQ